MVLFAKDILDKDFLTFSQDTSVLEAAKQMKTTRHGFAVIGSVASPVGIVTEWDIISKVVAEGQDPQSVKLREIMSTDMVSVPADTPISSVWQIMSEKGVRRLLVKQGDAVVGFVTSRTALAKLNEYVDRVTAQISKLQTPSF
jgi:CBS domain-containing protein